MLNAFYPLRTELQGLNFFFMTGEIFQYYWAMLIIYYKDSLLCYWAINSFFLVICRDYVSTLVLVHNCFPFSPKHDIQLTTVEFLIVQLPISYYLARYYPAFRWFTACTSDGLVVDCDHIWYLVFFCVHSWWLGRCLIFHGLLRYIWGKITNVILITINVGSWFIGFNETIKFLNYWTYWIY